MEYIKRIIDNKLDQKMRAFNAVNIIGPKGCGKTRTAKERCNTVIEFQDEEKRSGYLAVAETSPQLFLKNRKPILFDEWQDAPKIWGTLRKACDDFPEEVGNYYLTGSTSKKVNTSHTGTGRITELQMFPMTLYENGLSNGKVSLKSIIDDKSYNIDGESCNLSLEELFFAACCGGWPRCLALKEKDAKLEIAKDYFQQICNKDVSALDGKRKNSKWVRIILMSYARNMATTAKRTSIYTDVKANLDISESTINSYIEALENLFVIKDIDAWMPQIRSKTAIRASKKHIFIDPSIALAALGVGPEFFYNDLDLFGHVFENMVLRDLLVYAQAHDAHVMHYFDDMGLEADAVYQFGNGSYALIEIKVSLTRINEAEKNLLKFVSLIKNHNEKALSNPLHPRALYREPSALIIICANAPMAYTMASGVKVVPIGCLKD